MPSIFIVDEEYHFAENVASALRLEGIEAKVFQDATEALETLVAQYHSLDPQSVKLLIDVSLAPGDDLDTFSSQATDDFFRTGIVLVETLMIRCPGLCTAENTTLYTAHFATELWDQIEEFCNQNGFGRWQKAPDTSVDDVVSLVQ